MICTRNSIGDDTSFIYANWLRDLRAADRSPLPDDIWYDAHRAAITRVLADPKVRVIIAHPPGDTYTILGFCVAKPGEWLHWIHIHKRFRTKRTGIVKTLMDAAGVVEGTPAVWSLPSGRVLRNPPRPRQARPQLAMPVGA